MSLDIITEIKELSPSKGNRWKILKSLKEWLGTEISFDLISRRRNYYSLFLQGLGFASRFFGSLKPGEV